MGNSSEGYSSRGGQSRDPYNLAEQPGGSSSGPAGAVAANLCVFSLGTETDGSVGFLGFFLAFFQVTDGIGLEDRRFTKRSSNRLMRIGYFTSGQEWRCGHQTHSRANINRRGHSRKLDT